MLGSYNISDYTKKAAVAMFLFFAFFVILLMLNLLIAIMGESRAAGGTAIFTPPCFFV